MAEKTLPFHYYFSLIIFKAFLVPFVIFIPTILHAQQGTVASGGDVSGVGGTSSYSLGQVAYLGVQASLGEVNMGIQQSYEIYSSDVIDPWIEPNWTLYPNPTADLIVLEGSDLKLHAHCSYKLTDALGKLVFENNITEKQTYINLHSLSAATYTLIVASGNGILNTYKIIKSN